MLYMSKCRPLLTLHLHVQSFLFSYVNPLNIYILCKFGPLRKNNNYQFCSFFSILWQFFLIPTAFFGRKWVLNNDKRNASLHETLPTICIEKLRAEKLNSDRKTRLAFVHSCLNDMVSSRSDFQHSTRRTLTLPNCSQQRIRESTPASSPK